MTRPPRADELYRARELAEICLLEAALDVTSRILNFEHPSLQDPDPTDPPTLRAARQLLQRIQALRRNIARYSATVRAVALTPRNDDLPF
jgi:hypothetical protein